MELHDRKDIRLKGHDYSRPGCYFITVCTKNKHELLWADNAVGAAIGRPQLSGIGRLVEHGIIRISSIYSNASVDIYVIMPNHIHLILRLLETEAICNQPTETPAISRIISMFKSSVTKQLGYSIWQKLFHDHIIRTQEEYRKTWYYIHSNPVRWEEDCYYEPHLSDGSQLKAAPAWVEM